MSWLEREANLTLSALLKASASNTYKYQIHISLPLSNSSKLIPTMSEKLHFTSPPKKIKLVSPRIWEMASAAPRLECRNVES